MTGRAHLQGALVALAAGLASLACMGYAFHTGPNVMEFLPFVRAAADPTLYPGDVFVSTRDFFPSLFPRLMSLVPPASLESAHFVIYLLLRWVFLFLVWELGLELFGSRVSAALGTLAMAFSPQAALMSFLGEDPVMKTSLYQTSAAVPFGAAVFLFYLKGFYPAAFLSLGAMYFLNGLAGNYVAFALLVDTVLREDRKKILLWGWAVFLPAALLWLMLLPKGGLLPPPGNEFIPALKMWYPGHYFPGLWSAEKWTKAFFIASVLLGIWHCRARESRHGHVLYRFLLAVIALWCAGFVVGTLLPVRQLVALQLFRADTVFLLFALLLAGDAAAGMLRDDNLLSFSAAGLLLLAVFDIGSPAALPFAAVLLGVYALRAHMGRTAVFAAFAVPAVFLMLVWRQGAFSVRAAMFLLFAGLYAFGLYRKNVTGLSLPVRAGALALLAVLPFLPAAVGRAQSRSLEFLHPWEADLLSAEKWASDNTPKDALFLVPPETMGFRAFSCRPSFVEWLDGGAMHWVPGYSRVWLERLNALWAVSIPGEGGVPAPMSGQERVDAYYAITPTGFRHLSDMYGISYVLTRADVSLPFKAVFVSPSWSIYSLKRP